MRKWASAVGPWVVFVVSFFALLLYGFHSTGWRGVNIDVRLVFTVTGAAIVAATAGLATWVILKNL